MKDAVTLIIINKNNSKPWWLSPPRLMFSVFEEGDRTRN